MIFWRIKWEAILVILMFITTIFSWIFYMDFIEDIKALVLAIIPTFMLFALLIGYNSIKEFRHQVITLWK